MHMLGGWSANQIRGTGSMIQFKRGERLHRREHGGNMEHKGRGHIEKAIGTLVQNFKKP